jgi:hypothetical protein
MVETRRAKGPSVKTNSHIAVPTFSIVPLKTPLSHEQGVKLTVSVDHNKLPGNKDVFAFVPQAVAGGVAWKSVPLKYEPALSRVFNSGRDIFDVLLTTKDVGDLSVLTSTGVGFGIKPDNGPEIDLQTADDNWKIAQVAQRNFIPAKGTSAIKSYRNYSLDWGTGLGDQTRSPDLDLPGVGQLRLGMIDAMTAVRDAKGVMSKEVEAVILEVVGEQGRAADLQKLKNPELVLIDQKGREKGTIPLNTEEHNPSNEYQGSGHVGMTQGFGKLSMMLDAKAVRKAAKGGDLQVRLRAHDAAGKLVYPPKVMTIPAATIAGPSTGLNVAWKGQ